MPAAGNRATSEMNLPRRASVAAAPAAPDIDSQIVFGRLATAATALALAVAQLILGRPAQVDGALMLLAAAIYASTATTFFRYCAKTPKRLDAARVLGLATDAIFIGWTTAAGGEWAGFLYPFALGAIRSYENSLSRSASQIAAGVFAVGFLGGTMFSSFWGSHLVIVNMALFGFGMLALGPTAPSLMSVALWAGRGLRARQKDRASRAPLGAISRPLSDAASEPRPSRGVVLVIDPSATSRLMISRVLAKAGYEPREASDAAEARRLDSAANDKACAAVASADEPGVYTVLGSGGAALPIIGVGNTSFVAADCFVTMLPRPINFEALLSGVAAALAPASQMANAATNETESEPPQILDHRALRDLEKLGGADFVRAIVEQFVADGAAALRGLAHSMEAGNAALFRDQAHALRSSAANVGARGIYSTCLAWREIAPDELITERRRHMRDLAEQFETASRELTHYIAAAQNSEAKDREAA